MIHQCFYELSGNPFQQRAGPVSQPGTIVEKGEIKALPQGAEQVARQRLGLCHPGPKGFRALLRDEGVRILAIGQKQHPHGNAVVQRIECQLRRLPSGPAPRGVPVETQHHLRREAKELL